MKYLVILMLSMMLMACSGAKKQEGYADSKCNNLCTNTQQCVQNATTNRFYCMNTVEAITPTPGPDLNAGKCSPPCTGFSTCQIDTQTGKYHCGGGGSPNPNPK